MRRLQRILSGGQTGVDRAALDAAREAGLALGGWCPHGRRAEDGAIDPAYPLTETDSPLPLERTRLNVRDSDGTLILVRRRTGRGTRATLRFARAMPRPCLRLVIEGGAADRAALVRARRWIARYRIATLNIAGPRKSIDPGIYAAARAFLRRLFAEPG